MLVVCLMVEHPATGAAMRATGPFVTLQCDQEACSPATGFIQSVDGETSARLVDSETAYTHQACTSLRPTPLS